MSSSCSLGIGSGDIYGGVTEVLECTSTYRNSYVYRCLRMPNANGEKEEAQKDDEEGGDWEEQTKHEVLSHVYHENEATRQGEDTPLISTS